MKKIVVTTDNATPFLTGALWPLGTADCVERETIEIAWSAA
ncbi:hypothetical protein VB151_08255 [Xanthomonas fragariae]|nr:hypothetical protein [Xanthomonas fragariae]MEA5186507.1 hypothetical protein [Xanthomonas fragariae]MEA5219111.1 hypothetical protein [Xanthomonas fragariae]WIY74163.1 hypothetical protein OW158_08680 [Xanthomonas fragariae]